MQQNNCKFSFNKFLSICFPTHLNFSSWQQLIIHFSIWHTFYYAYEWIERRSHLEPAFIYQSFYSDNHSWEARIIDSWKQILKADHLVKCFDCEGIEQMPEFSQLVTLIKCGRYSPQVLHMRHSRSLTTLYLNDHWILVRTSYRNLVWSLSVWNQLIEPGKSLLTVSLSE